MLEMTAGWSVRALGALLAVSAMTCGTPPARDLHVLSYAPTGDQATATPIEVRFDKPVIEEGEVGKPAALDSLTLTPPVPWKGHWQDRQTLVVEPQAPLAESTEYSVKLAGRLAARTGGFGFSFTHRPLTVEGIWGVNLESLAPDGALPLSFNQSVKMADAVAHCVLLHGGDQRITLVAGDASTVGKTLPVRPVQPLAAGELYELRCEGLRGAGGNTAMAAPYTLALRARPRFSVLAAEPEGQEVDADSAELSISLSTAVELEAIRKAISSTPPIPGLEQGWLTEDDTVYRVNVDLSSKTKYTLRLGPMVDRFGQKLEAGFAHTFTSGMARPRISMERGIFALEASAPGYPVWSRNVSRFDVTCAAIPKNKLVSVLTTDMNYDPWGGNDDDRPLDWQKLGVAAKQKTHAYGDAADKWKLTNLDLGATCGAASGQRGVYLTEVHSEQIPRDEDRPWRSVRRNRVLANVTDLGVLLKVGTSSGVVWVTSLASGTPVAGAAVTVYTPQGKAVYRGTTDASGLVKVPGSAVMKQQSSTDDAGAETEGDWDSYRSQRMLAVIEKGPDVAVVDGNWANGIQIWNYGFPEERRGGKVVVRGFLQSDRGLYRPGETVHFKGLVREITAGRPPRVPTQKTPVAVSIEDSRGQVVYSGSAKLSAFGGFSFDFALPAEAAVGDYYVSSTAAGQLFRERFSVEEFRPATFEVKVAPPAAPVRPGQALAFTVDARYLFGAPVAGAKVAWTLHRRAHVLRFAGYDEYTFSATPTDYWWMEREPDYGELVADGEAETDSQGHLVVETRDATEGLTGPHDYILAASVTDSADQTMNKSVMVEAHQASLYFGIHTQEYVQAVGMPFGINLVALRPDGTRAAATGKLSFIRTVQSCDWQDVGPRSYPKCDASEKVMLERQVSIASAGSTVERIYPTEPGDYVVKLEGKDDRGQPVLAQSTLWVIGKGEAFWSGDESARMGLIASRPSYRPGDVARLVPQANLKKPTALVTIERDGILDARVVRLDSPAQGLELQIAEGWAPNVFASVALVSGRQGRGDRHRPQFKMGMVELKVASEHRELQVAVELTQENVRPGEPVSGVIRVTHGGKPVAAEVALSAADEGVLQLIGYQTPNPMKTFYATWGLGVDSGTNLNRLARIADPMAGDPDEGGDSASSQGRVRSRFVSSAYWAPALVTDARGEARFSFAAPDNLSAFRLMAVAADAGDRFGAGERRLTIAKPLMAQPVLPRFLRADDVLSVGVVVHNKTGAAGVATVTAEGKGVTLGSASATVPVPAGGSARVRFAAKTQEQEAAQLTFAVALGSERDAVTITLPVERPRVRQTRALVSQKVEREWRGSFTASAGTLADESELEITIDRTGLGDLAPSLRYLVEYPYGCLEQTLSRTVPLLAARELTTTLGDRTFDSGRAEAFLKAGVAKVARHQQGDGHFSLWPQSQTYPHLTVLALWGLGEAQAAGFAVPSEVFEQGVRALATWVAKPGSVAPGGQGATAAMAAFVLAQRGRADAGLHARLFEQRAALPRWGQAFLLRAMHKARAPQKQLDELRALLTASAASVPGGGVLVRESGHESRYMSSDVRASAMTLVALLEVAPADPLIGQLVSGLRASRDASGRWRNTQDNSWSLIALAKYGKRAAAGSSTARVSVGASELAKKVVTGGQVAVVRTSLAKLGAGELRVQVEGGAFVTARVTEVKRDGGEAQDRGFTVRRELVDAADKPVTQVRAGSLVKVKVFVETTVERAWVAVEDPLPAGLEVVNPKLAAGAGGEATQSDGQRYWWQEVTWDHQELRDDRVLWFSDRLPAGRYVLTYQARATTDGTFLALPAHAEAMYEPEVMGRSEMGKLVVAP